MASIIKIKRSESQGSVPGSLSLGELAVNLYDRKIYAGNSTGVTAVGGEQFRLTTKAATSGSGAYLRIFSDTPSFANNVLLDEGEGINITLEGNGSIMIAGEDATDSNKGIASFSSGDFVVSSGAVTLANTATGAVVIINGTANEVDVSRTNGEVTIGLPDDVFINGQLNVNENIVVAGNTVAQGILNVTGLASLDGGIDVDGAFTVGDTNGNIGTSGTLTVGSTTALHSLTTTTITANGAVNIDDTTGSTSTTTGALIVDGGVGIAQNAYVGGDIRVSGDAIIDGNLTVEGSVTYISSSTVNVDDSMLKLSANNAADTVDTGVYSKYVVSGNSAIQYTGYFRDAGDGVYKFYTGLDVEPTTTVDTTDTGYTLAQVDAIIDGGSY